MGLNSSSGNNTKSRVDLYLKKGDKEYYIEIKTAKPNIDVFRRSKEKLQTWIAIRNKTVSTIIVIPYNPYNENYDRFTIQGVLNSENELLVGKEYWSFLNNNDPETYDDVLNIFNEIGKEYHEKIQLKIKQIADGKR